MFTYIPLLFYLLYSTCRSNANEAPLQYSDEDFSSRIADHQTALVMFYAPWCGHCKKIKPEFDKAARTLIMNDPPVALVKVDCSKSGKTTCNNQGVSGYPTLKIFREGSSAKTYSGPRDAAGIIEYMKLQAGPSSKEFVDAKELEEYLQSEIGVVILGLFDEDAELKNVFLKSANNLRDKVKFAYTTSKTIRELYEITDGILLIRPRHLRNKFEDFQMKYPGGALPEELDEFVVRNYHGLVGLRVETNRDDFRPPFIIGYYDVDYKKNPKGTNYWRNRFLKVASQYKDKLTFAISHIKEMKEFGDVASTKNSPIIFAKNSDNRNFKMTEEFSVEALENFTKNFLSGDLETFIKSEPIPKSNDKAVKIAVAKNFDQVVVNNGKDTMIVFHSPWCGHCQKLMPVYVYLAETLQDEDVVLVKMDATLNDVPPAYKLEGYPTIYWANKDAKNAPIIYEGGRSEEEFIAFIAKHATEELKRYDRNGKSKNKDEL